jgi:hypothetical protein
VKTTPTPIFIGQTYIDPVVGTILRVDGFPPYSPSGVNATLLAVGRVPKYRGVNSAGKISLYGPVGKEYLPFEDLPFEDFGILKRDFVLYEFYHENPLTLYLSLLQRGAGLL